MDFILEITAYMGTQIKDPNKACEIVVKIT